MKRSVTIISKDNRFARMLAIELSSVGVEVISDGATENKDPDAEKYTVIDLDTFEPDDILGKDMGIVIGISKRDKKDIKDKYIDCSFFFKRPFITSELLQIFANTDRREIHKPKSSYPHKKLHYLTVDKKEKTAVWGDMKIPLSENEYMVLALLCESRGRLVERERIYSILGAEDGNMGDVYICHLRRKIDNKLGLKLIYTLRGKGYMLKN